MMTIVFDPLKGELALVKTSKGKPDGRLDFGERLVGDVALDMGNRLNENSLFDLESRK